MLFKYSYFHTFTAPEKSFKYSCFHAFTAPEKMFKYIYFYTFTAPDEVCSNTIIFIHFLRKKAVQTHIFIYVFRFTKIISTRIYLTEREKLFKHSYLRKFTSVTKSFKTTIYCIFTAGAMRVEFAYLQKFTAAKIRSKHVC